jgi:hypothetical protein
VGAFEDEPGLLAELDDAEDVVMRGVTIETEWGVRYHDTNTEIAYGTDGGAEAAAREMVSAYPRGKTVVSRKVTYGPWEPARPSPVPGAGKTAAKKEAR